jgi:hypothetical protein
LPIAGIILMRVKGLMRFLRAARHHGNHIALVD